MIKKLASHLGEYRRAAILTPMFSALEAVMDILLPTIMAFIIDLGIEKGDMNAIVKYGLLTFAVAAIALLLGILAGKYAAEASTGFAGNLRDAMYENIQHYSFSNIDKFSTAGLVTRMTTDVTNLQNAFQMMERMCVRAPVHLVFALIMAFSIGGPLALIFVVAVAFLLAVLASIMVPTFKIFDRVFKNYDNLNASVQENVSAIRVVKSFVREGFENEKYTKACEGLYQQFVNAESRLSFNSPAMLTAIYGCNIALSWFGAKYILHGALTTGQLNALFGYIMNILMALMMLSMAFVMISMSAASAKRIVEVLDEKTDLPPAKAPVQEVKDGSIRFDHVTFKYKHGSGQPVLNDITFDVKPGETLGIIGGTGSAKSSLVLLTSLLVEVAAALRLAVVDFLIDRVVLQQFLVGAEAVDLAVVQHEDAVGILHRGNALCNDDLGGAGDLLTERLPDLCVGGGIHGTGGVVEDEDLRLAQQGTGDGQTLFLAAGHVGAALLDPGVVLVREALDELIGAG